MILDSCFLLISFCYFLFENSVDQPLLLLEHDELNALLNGIDCDQPLSPLKSSLPTDPDVITLLSSSSSPISPVILSDQPPNASVDKFLQSLTNNQIQFTDHPATTQQESGVNILLPSLFGSKAQSNETKSEESQSNPSSLRRNPKLISAKSATFKQKRRESLHRHHKSVRKPGYNPCFYHQLTNAFSSWEIVLWDYKRQEYTIPNTVLSSQRFVVPLSFIEVQHVE